MSIEPADVGEFDAGLVDIVVGGDVTAIDAPRNGREGDTAQEVQ